MTINENGAMGHKGKGAIRYSQPKRIDFNVIESVLRATVESRGVVC